MAIANRRTCVVLVIDDLEYGGAQRQVIELANSMDPDRFEVHVCTLSDYVPLGEQLQDSENRLHIIAKRCKYDLTVITRLARLLKSLNADIVHSFLFSADIASRLAGRLVGIKLVVGSERNAYYSPKKRNILAYRLTGKYADIMIANSRSGAKFNSETYGLPASKYSVVYNGVDTLRFTNRNNELARNELELPSDRQIIGVFASFKSQKNHAMILRAFRKLIDFLPDTQLLLVGAQLYGNMMGTADYNARMESLIDELGIRHHCTFLGNRNDVERIYPVCDVTALSSLYEGTPNVLLESMACGVPIVATNVCDNSYVVKDGETGFLVELDDIDGMAERLQMLLADDAMRQKMGREARNWVVNEFSLNQLARKTEAVYLEALSNKRNKRKRRA